MSSSGKAAVVIFILCLLFGAAFAYYVFRSQAVEWGDIHVQEDIHLTVGWTGEERTVRGPISSPDPGSQRRRLESWDKQAEGRYTSTDPSGAKYAIRSSGKFKTREGRVLPKVAAISLYRPDGTLELETSFTVEEGELVADRWTYYGESGRGEFLHVERERDARTGEYDVVSVRTTLDTGDRREWRVNKHGIIVSERILDRQGGEVEILHSVDPNTTTAPALDLIGSQNDLF